MADAQDTLHRRLVIVGASARAACSSAARAGFSPWWIDQFGDADLRARFPGIAVAAGNYPAGIAAALEQAPMAPVLYTGALENHPQTLEQIALRRPLLGNSAAVCVQVRDPTLLEARFRDHGIVCPPRLPAGVCAPATGRWLRKPLRSGGGFGIESVRAGFVAGAGCYLQEFRSGTGCSAVYIGAADGARLLGVTLQLVGERDFHAPLFSYCGSLGPITPAPAVMTQWQRAGDVLTREFGLRGLFGVDAVVEGGRLTVIEVNPRYTASVEVLEGALGIHAVALHVAACGGPSGSASWPSIAADAGADAIHGKAVLFAPHDLEFNDAAADRVGSDDAALYADIPSRGTRIPRGAPVLTILGHATSVEGCAASLRERAREIFRALGAQR